MEDKVVAITAYDIYKISMEYDELTDKQKDELLFALSLKTKEYDVPQEQPKSSFIASQTEENAIIG